MLIGFVTCVGGDPKFLVVIVGPIRFAPLREAGISERKSCPTAIVCFPFHRLVSSSRNGDGGNSQPSCEQQDEKLHRSAVNYVEVIICSHFALLIDRVFVSGVESGRFYTSD